MDTLQKDAKQLQDILVKDRRFLHQHAEIGFQVKHTVEYLQKRLQEMGYQPKRVGGGLTVCVGNANKRAFLLRADIDGLPIKEKSVKPFSCTLGNMHACGHDLHATMLLGAAKLLKDREQSLNGCIKLYFQPSEENLEGAKRGIADGVLSAPKVYGAMALHVAVGTPLKTGTIVFPKGGTVAPSADFFQISVKGKSCHGAAPQKGVDALSVAAHIVVGLQAFSAREIPAFSGGVLTIGKLSAGVNANVIAGNAELYGTFRIFDEVEREKCKRRMQEIVKGIAKAHGATAKLVFTSGCPSLYNDEELAVFFAEQGKVWTVAAVQPNDTPSVGGSEDFAYISRAVPSVLFAISAGSKEDGYVYPLHHEKVVFDEAALWQGTYLYAACGLAMDAKKDKKTKKKVDSGG